MEKLLTAIQLSEILQVKLSTIRKWTQYGFILVVKMGALVRYKEKEIEKLIFPRESGHNEERMVI